MTSPRKKNPIKESTDGPDHVLRAAGLKVTPARREVLQVLEKSPKPLSVHTVVEALGTKADQVTVYRTLESLVSAGLARTVDLHHGHAHFELVVGREHHHHLVCESCGTIEDVEVCADHTLERSVLKQSRSFASIRSHALEFFGLCTQCAR